jgi:preprotein translocase subunit SecD
VLKLEKEQPATGMDAVTNKIVYLTNVWARPTNWLDKAATTNISPTFDLKGGTWHTLELDAAKELEVR